jgi:hypothetical protein
MGEDAPLAGAQLPVPIQRDAIRLCDGERPARTQRCLRWCADTPLFETLPG